MPSPTLIGGVYFPADAINVKAGYVAHSIAVQAGDLIEVMMVSGVQWSNGVRHMVDGGGIVWTPVQQHQVSGYPSAELWAGSVTSAGTITVGVGELRFGGHSPMSASLRVWRNARLGASAVAHGAGSPSISLTTTAAASKVSLLTADIGYTNTARTALSIGSGSFSVANDIEDFNQTYYTFGGLYSDAGSPGAKTVGVSSPSGQTWGIVAAEIVGIAGIGSADIVEAGDVVAAAAATSGGKIVAIKNAPLSASDVVTEVGFRLYRQVDGALVQDGLRNTVSVQAIPFVPNGYRALLKDNMMTLDADGGYRGVIVWDTGGEFPAYLMDEVYVPTQRA